MSQSHLKKKAILIPVTTGLAAGLLSIAVFHLIIYLEWSPPFSHLLLMFLFAALGTAAALIMVSSIIHLRFKAAFLIAFMSTMSASLVILTEIAIRMEYEISDLLSVAFVLVMLCAVISGAAGLLFVMLGKSSR